MKLLIPIIAILSIIGIFVFVNQSYSTDDIHPADETAEMIEEKEIDGEQTPIPAIKDLADEEPEGGDLDEEENVSDESTTTLSESESNPTIAEVVEIDSENSSNNEDVTIEESIPESIPEAEVKPLTENSEVDVDSNLEDEISAEEAVEVVSPPKEDEATEIDQTNTISVEAEPSSPEVELLSHDAWDELTRKYVSSSGKVNYKGFKSELSKLNEYIKLLKDNPPQSSWSKNKKLAYWINVYNAYTVKLIADNYPVSSITKLHNGSPWKARWVEVGNDVHTLDEVENAIIRPRFKDARIHFAVNCAALSCPPLMNAAWTESNLQSRLEAQTKKFINNEKYNQISGNSASVSKIFEWYAEDFGDLREYLNKYSDVQIAKGTKITFQEYDWGLNE